MTDHKIIRGPLLCITKEHYPLQTLREGLEELTFLELMDVAYGLNMKIKSKTRESLIEEIYQSRIDAQQKVLFSNIKKYNQ